MTEVMLIMVGVVFGAVIVLLMLRRLSRSAPLSRVHSQTIFERVSVVGKLVGLEVRAKEITTSTKGWAKLPPLLLSPAKMAMIFNFEKQYAVDLSQLEPEDVRRVGRDLYRVTLPPVESSLRLLDLTPYDIQAGRVLGLLDVVQMNASNQQQLMEEAQEQAAELYEQNEREHVGQAKLAIEKQIRSMLSLFDVDVDVVWSDGAAPSRVRTKEKAPELALVA